MHRVRPPVAARIRFWSIVGVTATAYLQTVFLCSQPWLTSRNLAVLGLSVVYSLGCIFAQPWCEARSNTRWNVIYFAVQLPLAAALLFSMPVRGPGVYFVLPLVSQVMFVFSLRTASLLSAALFIVATAPLALAQGWVVALQYTPAYLAGFIFTAGLSHLLARETTARLEAVALGRELAIANERLRENAAQAGELAVAHERNRLAREIHDGLGHYLTTIAVQAEAARALLTKDAARAAASIATTRTLAEEALTDVRRSVGLLRADQVRAPLPAQLQTLADGAGFPVTVATLGALRTLPLAVEHALHRTAQEGLTNVRKHAQATQAAVTLDFRTAGHVVVEIVDDGRNVNGHHSTGFGLNGVRERIESLGGLMLAGRREAGGFRLRVEVPG